jgi:heme oxygenase (biliverdin-IX-beta and delta-forming)
MTIDAHARPSGDAPEPLYDVTVPTPTHAERARTLVAGISTGTLCTIAIEPVGYPYGSFVTVAFDEGDPVFLISALAEHTRNLERDPRASLLVAEGGSDDPLANGRVTMLGECRRIAADHAAEVKHAGEAFFAVHQNARYYADFRDFAFWKLRVDAVRYIGGYGRMSWVDVAAWRAGEPDPIAPHASAIIDHMNADHADAMVAFCRALTRATDTTAATMTGVDRYGFEMSAQTGRGPRPIRLPFPAPIVTPDDARRAMVALVRRARELLAADPGTSTRP